MRKIDSQTSTEAVSAAVSACQRDYIIIIIIIIIIDIHTRQGAIHEKRKEKKKIAEKREVWTSGQLDSVPSPTEGLRAPGLTTGPHMYSTEMGSVIYITKNTTKKI